MENNTTWWVWWLIEFVTNSFFSMIISFIIAVIVTVILIWLSKIVSKKIRDRVVQNSIAEDDVYEQRIWELVWSMVFYPLLLISLFVGFQIIWFDIWLLLWWLSVGLWFAFREILWNMFAWIMILLTKEIKLWDRIEINMWIDRTFLWTIEEITIRYTVLRTVVDNRRVIVPNLDMITYPIMTYTSEDYIKMYAFVLVSYDENIDRAVEVVKEATNASPLVSLKEKTTVVIQKIWDSWAERALWVNTSNWVELRVQFFIDPASIPDWPPMILWKVNQSIYKWLLDNWIKIPYPHTSHTVDKNDKNILWTALYLMKNSKQ